jgi:lipoprotein NlpI
MRPYLVFVAATVVIGLFDTFATPQVRGDDSPADFIRRAAEFSAAGKSREAVDAATRAISLQPGAADAYYLRGREHFRLGEIEKSVADFEKLVELRPARKASLWELGISYYYAGEHENGARLFELYQTYHDSDVENGVWRYLCMARTDGVEKARAELLPIKNDPRVPMSEIYDLYRGRTTAGDVLAAANAGDPPPEALKALLFYAHLYIGLHHEAAGRRKEAQPHITKAAGEYRISHYMGDVARVHLGTFSADAEPAQSP